MGTEYKLCTDDSYGQITICEMSNRLTLTNGDTYGVALPEDIHPEDMAKIMLEGLTVCSYWMDTDELKALITDHMDKKIY